MPRLIDEPQISELSRALQTKILLFTRRYLELCFAFYSVCAILVLYLVSHDGQAHKPLYWFVCVLAIFAICWAARLSVFRMFASSRRKLRCLSLLAFVEGSALASMLWWFEGATASAQVLIVMLLLCGLVVSILVTAGYQALFLPFSLPIAVALTGVALFGERANTAAMDGRAIEYYLCVCVGVFMLLLLQRLASTVYGNIRDALAASYHNKQTNQNLKAAVLTAKKANESKTRFLASASHDLRQPINSLALFIASLKLQTETAAQQDIVDAMAESIESIDSQLESLLDISKLDAGIVEVRLHVIDLVEFVARIVASYQSPQGIDGTDFSQSDVPVHFVSELEVGLACAVVETDPVLLDRVIRNLIGNAIKYTPTGQIKVLVSKADGQAVVSIQDTGVGISAEHLNSVFDEFYQVDNPQRDAKRGLGLGLSIVQRLCELLKHQMFIRSKVGLGTVVKLMLPLSASSGQEMSAKLNVKFDGRAMNILVLDNESSILDAMGSVLTRMGHCATLVASAQDAILEFNRTLYDIALIDYRLPGALSGVDIIKQFCRLDPRVRCFLVTGDSNIKEDLSSVDIIYKPVTADKLSQIFSG